jgi:hypothetical protein
VLLGVEAGFAPRVGRLVGDDDLGLLVPQHRHTDAAVVIGLGGTIGLGEELEPVHLVCDQAPPALVAVRVRLGDPEVGAPEPRNFGRWRTNAPAVLTPKRVGGS